MKEWHEVGLDEANGMEAHGIEPRFPACKTGTLPLSYAPREVSCLSKNPQKNISVGLF